MEDGTKAFLAAMAGLLVVALVGMAASISVPFLEWVEGLAK